MTTTGDVERISFRYFARPRMRGLLAVLDKANVSIYPATGIYLIRRACLGTLLLLLPLLSACSKDPPSGPATPSGKVSQGANPKAKPESGRSGGGNWKGRWKLAFTQNVYEFEFCLLDITKKDKEFDVQVVGFADLFGAAELKTAEITGDEVHLVFSSPVNPFDFRGTLRSGSAVGTILVPQKLIAPAKMSITDVATLTGKQEKLAPGGEEYLKALNSGDQAASVNGFLQAFPSSPLALDAYKFLFLQAKKEKFNEKQAQEYVDEYLAAARHWGPRLEPKVYFDVGALLAAQDYLPELASKLLLRAESQLNEDTPDEWRISLASGLLKIGKTDSAIELVRPLHERDPHGRDPLHPLYSFTLAQALEKRGDTAAAMELYSELAVVPMQERMLRQIAPESTQSLPSEAFARLWKAEHGDTQGLDAHLKQVYLNWIAKFAEKRESRSSEEQGRTALLEVFTGTSCPPCISADLAFEALQHAYSSSELVVLQYHEHIPAFDPLANSETLERYRYYSPLGTPAAYLNGKEVQAVGGGISEVERVYKQVRDLIEPILARKPGATLQLSAQAENGKLTLSATVDGIEDHSSDLRLRLAILEEEVEFLAPNGIRTHANVVRSMPGGHAGLELQDGKLDYRQEIALPEFKTKLLKGLTDLEENSGFDFPIKPLALKKLRFVAFLQNNKTQEVLQAALIPVNGTISFEQAEE